MDDDEALYAEDEDEVIEQECKRRRTGAGPCVEDLEDGEVATDEEYDSSSRRVAQVKNCVEFSGEDREAMEEEGKGENSMKEESDADADVELDDAEEAALYNVTDDENGDGDGGGDGDGDGDGDGGKDEKSRRENENGILMDASNENEGESDGEVDGGEIGPGASAGEVSKEGEGEEQSKDEGAIIGGGGGGGGGDNSDGEESTEEGELPSQSSMADSIRKRVRAALKDEGILRQEGKSSSTTTTSPPSSNVSQREARYFTLSHVVCSRCGLKGHMSFACTEGSEDTAKVERCFICNSSEHVSRNCRRTVRRYGQRRQVGAPRQPHLECYVCGETGHLDCSVGKVRGVLSCCNCGRLGHMHAGCDRPLQHQVLSIARSVEHELADSGGHGRKFHQSPKKLAKSLEISKKELKRKQNRDFQRLLYDRIKRRSAF